MEKKASRVDGPTSSYLGLTKKEATARASASGLRSRTVKEDSERFMVTSDIRADRINFEVDGGLVTAAKMY